MISKKYVMPLLHGRSPIIRKVATMHLAGRMGPYISACLNGEKQQETKAVSSLLTPSEKRIIGQCTDECIMPMTSAWDRHSLKCIKNMRRKKCSNRSWKGLFTWLTIHLKPH